MFFINLNKQNLQSMLIYQIQNMASNRFVSLFETVSKTFINKQTIINIFHRNLEIALMTTQSRLQICKDYLIFKILYSPIMQRLFYALVPITVQQMNLPFLSSTIFHPSPSLEHHYMGASEHLVLHFLRQSSLPLTQLIEMVLVPFFLNVC